MPWTKPHRRQDGSFDPGQVGLVKMYQRYAGVANQEYRALLHELTGHTSSTVPELTQYDFDMVMPALEIRAHLAEINKRSVGKRLARIRDWYYWRKRCPKTGAVSSREKWKIMELWEQLKPFLHDDHRDEHAYLVGIATHACGYTVKHVDDMKSWQALALIEALKDRLKYAVRKGA